MALIEWTEDLNTGIQVIDNQHQRIVEYINTLDDVSRIPDREVVGKVVGDLIDYTYSHFAFEEALMEEAGYEYLSIHQNTHNSFCERIDQFRKRFDDGEDIAESLAELLRAWLINHIMSDDESYAALVKDKDASHRIQTSGDLARLCGEKVLYLLTACAVFASSRTRSTFSAVIGNAILANSGKRASRIASFCACSGR